MNDYNEIGARLRELREVSDYTTRVCQSVNKNDKGKIEKRAINARKSLAFFIRLWYNIDNRSIGLFSGEGFCVC